MWAPAHSNLWYRSLLLCLQDMINSHVNPSSFKSHVQKFALRFTGYWYELVCEPQLIQVADTEVCSQVYRIWVSMNSYVNPSSFMSEMQKFALRFTGYQYVWTCMWTPAHSSLRYRSLLPGLQDININLYVNSSSFKSQIQKFAHRFTGYQYVWDCMWTPGHSSLWYRSLFLGLQDTSMYELICEPQLIQVSQKFAPKFTGY